MYLMSITIFKLGLVSSDMNISKYKLYDDSGKSLTVIIIGGIKDLEVTLISGRYTV